MSWVSKIFKSKYFRLIFSGLLLVLAFRRIDVLNLLKQMSTIPWWFVVFSLVFVIAAMSLGIFRWSLLVIKKPKWSDFRIFFRSAYMGAFYSLFIPSAVGGDLIKWLPLIKKYPAMSKIKIASSVLIDRIIGFTAFVLMAGLAVIVGKFLNYSFPDYLVWLFLGLGVGVVAFYIAVFTVDFEKILGKNKLTVKLLEVADLLKKENKKRLLLCFGISLLAEPIWILPYWFNSLMFQAGIDWLSIYIFVPVISLVLVLPVSVAGFGAREQLFLYFFSQLGVADEKILLVSAFYGIITVVNNLLGFVFTLI